jgi:putative flippase GtrA
MPAGESEEKAPLIERHAPLLKMAARFVAGGTLNTGATLVLYWVLIRFMHYQWAYLASFCAGVLLSYVLNVRYVFRTKHTWLKLGLFPLIYLVTYAVGALALKVAVDGLGIPRGAAPLVSIAATLPISFLLSKLVLQVRGRVET